MGPRFFMTPVQISQAHLFFPVGIRQMDFLAFFLVLFSILSTIKRANFLSLNLSPAEKLNGDVLVLGAGIAGVSAAKTLAEHNITNFIILEAGNRIGGRVKSVVLNSTNTRVELGANWIQGIDPNNPMKHPLWKIVDRCGGLKGQFVKDFNNGTIHVFDEKGTNISSSKIFRKRLAFWNKILNPGLPTYSVQRMKAKLPDISTRQALTDLGWQPSSPMDDLIEWYGMDLDETAMALNTFLCTKLFQIRLIETLVILITQRTIL